VLGSDIFADGYSHIPSFLDKPWIHTVASEGKDFDLSGKWSFVISEGYHFLVGDHLLYPRDYVSNMVKKIEGMKRHAIVGVESYVFTSPFSNYKISNNHTKPDAFMSEDTAVHALGTYTLAYHTSTIEFPDHAELFKYREHYLIDHLIVSLYAQNRSLPLYAIARPQGWLSSSEPSELPESGEGTADTDQMATSLIRSTISSWRRRFIVSQALARR